MSNESRGSVASIHVDSPSLIDEFGPHERLANALRGFIEKNDGGINISIEGPWGVGKSTVIELLDKSISDEKILIATYDAWTHSGDPLRKEFLGFLVNRIVAKKWVDEGGEDGKKWLDKIRKRISGATRITRTSTRVISGWREKIFFISLVFFLPFGVWILSETLKKIISPGWESLSSHFQLWFSLGIGLVTVFCIQILLALFREEWSSILSTFLTKKFDEDSEIYETPEQSSLDFQEIFRSIMGSVLNDGRKLVIVIDNLDRLPGGDADNAWSMLRSFVDNSAFRDEPWLRRLWVIVPIANLDAGYRPVASGIESFWGKIFQIRLSLPLPVLSNWKKYLSGKLMIVFPDIEEDQIHNISGIYEICMEAKVRAPTPRELLLFVNDIAALKMLWGGRFRHELLAAYVCDSRKNDFLESLKRSDIPLSSVSRLIGGSGLSDDYAIIYFGLKDEKESISILRAAEINSALIRGNGSELKKILDENPYSVHMLETFLYDLGNGIPDNFITFYRAIVAICGYNEVDFDGDSCGLIVRGRLNTVFIGQVIAGLRSTIMFPFAHKICAQGLVALLRTLDRDDVTELIASTICELGERPVLYQEEGLPNMPHNNEFPTGTNVANWAASMKLVCSDPKIREYFLNRGRPLTLNIPLSLWAAICGVWGLEDDRIYEIVCPGVDSEHIFNIFSKNISSPSPVSSDEVIMFVAHVRKSGIQQNHVVFAEIYSHIRGVVDNRFPWPTWLEVLLSGMGEIEGSEVARDFVSKARAILEKRG